MSPSPAFALAWAVTSLCLVAGIVQAFRPMAPRRRSRPRRRRNVLFVCTGNLVRSPVAEALFRRMTGRAFRTRSAGLLPTSPRPLGTADVRWADVIAVMEERHWQFVRERWPEAAPKLLVLGVEDRYRPEDPALRWRLQAKLGALLAGLTGARRAAR